jgi:outer membrane protein OmpA-like peptidoglycan-associated protein
MKVFLSSLFVVFFSCFFLAAQTMPPIKPAKTTEIYFDFAKHDLRPEADSLLKQLLNYTKSKENFTIRITAHTDSIGSLANNQALSERRAQAVKDFLVKNGVLAERIRFEFFGEKQPATSNDSEANRQRNRRATVDVLLARSMVVVEGTVTDEKTGQPLVADVIFRSKEFNDSLRTGADGRFRKEVPAGTVLGLDAFAHCHFMGTSMVKAMPKLPPVTLPLKPVEKGAMIDIDNLYFVGNQPVLLENSKPELPKILRFMQANPSMKIEIAGHVNRPNNPPVGKESWDFKLSEDRAKVVYNYLVENGIPAERVSWKGYGNHEMRYPHSNNEREQALNRRVELRVLEGECK